MKVIKRDGRAVDYDRQKIVVAIKKANEEVSNRDKATKEEINSIIKYIEELGKKRMLVEDIQDIIEQKLMEMQRYDLAKKYIVYRYTRALIREQSSTDETIIKMLRKESERMSKENAISNTRITSMQRDYVAG